MGKYLIVILGLALALGIVFIIWRAEVAKAPTDQTNKPNQSAQEITINSKNMRISSSAFAEGESIPQKYSCDGEKINPPLAFSGVPENAKSLALIVDDPDASSGNFTHWAVWNIKPDTADIAENSVPEGAVQGANGAGNLGYAGPCPPSGTHRYFFKLYALDTTELSLSPNAKVDELMQMMEGHVIDSAKLLGKYGR